MTNLEKIEKWANENGYKFKHANLNTTMSLEKEEMIHDTFATKCIFIALEYNTYKLLSIKSYIDHYITIENAQELEDLFIPLNNVKRDEKLLKEYLKK